MSARRLPALVVVMLSISALNSTVAADPLQGHLNQSSTRINRPANPMIQPQKPISATVTDDSFKLKAEEDAAAAAASDSQPAAQADATAESGETQPASPLAASTTQSSLKPAASINAGFARGSTGGTAAGKADQPNYDYSAKQPLQGSVTFRFCYYDLGDGAECAWEGLRDAIYLQGRGVDIALMLDRGGVRLANKHNSHEYQLHRGSTERMVQTQLLLRQFIQNRGKVYVSERWARQFGLWGGSYPSLTHGVQLLGDEEMADLLVERSGRIVDY